MSSFLLFSICATYCTLSDDVMELLTFIFHSEAVQKKLDLLIANRKELGQPNGS